MDFTKTSFGSREKMQAAFAEFSALRDKQYPNNRVKTLDPIDSAVKIESTANRDDVEKPFLSPSDLLRAKQLVTDFQEAFGLFNRNLVPMGPADGASQFMNGPTPPNEADKRPNDDELSMHLSHCPHQYKFAVWGEVFPPGQDEPVDLIYDEGISTYKALDLAVLMRGDFCVDSFCIVGNAIHKAFIKGWSDLPAEPELARNFICIRRVLGEDSLPTVLGLEDPPVWPQSWPHKLARSYS